MEGICVNATVIFLCFVGKHVIDCPFHHNEPSATKPALFFAVYNYLPCICIHFPLLYCFVYFPSLGCHHLVSAFPQLLFVQHFQFFALKTIVLSLTCPVYYIPDLEYSFFCACACRSCLISWFWLLLFLLEI